MDNLLIPQADTIPVAWGWFQLLLLLTFPLHLLAMNAMLGGLALGIIQHFRGGELQSRLAHRIALALPMLVALTVNLGVAAYLFIQILYGQFIYTSSILMGIFWIAIVPLLIIAYAGAYLYDFKFDAMGRGGIVVAIMVCLIFIMIAYFFSNNMLLMVLPEKFTQYFDHMNGSLLVTGTTSFLPRYLHMLLGALAVGGLFITLLGRFRADRDPQLAEHALEYGMRSFVIFTIANICVGFIYMMSLPREMMLLFMGRDLGATLALVVGLLLTVGVLATAIKRRLKLTIAHLVALVYVMVFMRAWLRSGYLREHFTLDGLQLVPQYSPMIFFFITLGFGLLCLGWLWRKTAECVH